METIKPYRRRVHYYETDKMGVTHHANYIRWMEEARVDFMDQLGFPYADMEERGVFSPVTGLSCEYRRPCTFGDEVEITVRVASFDGVTLQIDYRMTRVGDGTLLCEASSRHCFLNREGHFVRLKRELPDFYRALRDCEPAQSPREEP